MGNSFYKGIICPPFTPVNRCRMLDVMKKLMLIVGVVLLATGLYLMLNVTAPYIPSTKTPAQKQKNDLAKNSVTVPSVGIYAPIIEGNADALNQGAWHRFPDRGNPVKGGTFILSAHSFIFRLNPLQTRLDSYFFNLHKTKVGDKVNVVWDKKEYSYTVTKTYDVKPDAVEIEQVTGTDHLVMYTCTPGGSADGRVVIEARPDF